MMISVVIPTCHRDGDLALCLSRLAPEAQTCPEASYEVIVSDDGKSSTAERMIRERFPWVRWVAGPRRGPAANRNEGARHACGDWLAFTDDDCLPDPKWLASFQAAISEGPIETSAVLEGRTIPDGPKRHPLEEAPINERGGMLWSCNFSIRRELFVEIGGFDERFPYPAMEDVDLRVRLAARGVRPTFVQQAIVNHPWRIPDLKTHWRRHLKSQMIFLRLHPDQSSWFSLRSHLYRVARYYYRDFPGDLRTFGWGALRCQPLLWYGHLLHAWVLWRQPEPAEMKA